MVIGKKSDELSRQNQDTFPSAPTAVAVWHLKAS
jgi:hypothetical protein